ncbi:hypothetical protein [Sporolactobacillus laevolacticus]|uniref:hypothetical protein n=1 Tax=Sporolactobacillus laevolacticus TaxID=33018 RepID=UPI0025B576A5|nr:hypothetical protein [Sporolactobacillus laevolacticus]MDN3956509.1 hypothetical protein [Sporolactobacillus laevolacticus]
MKLMIGFHESTTESSELNPAYSEMIDTFTKVIDKIFEMIDISAEVIDKFSEMIDSTRFASMNKNFSPRSNLFYQYFSVLWLDQLFIVNNFLKSRPMWVLLMYN